MLKKVLIALILTAFLAPSVGLAIVELPSDITISSCRIRHNLHVLGDKFASPMCPDKDHYASYATQAHCCLVDRVLVFIDWFFWGLIIISFLILLVGAFHILTAGGNPDKVALGRKFITFAVVGIALAVLSFIIPRMVIRIVY